MNVPKDKINSKRLFILDTNVLIHDPTALFQFQEHDIYLPMVVLEELDGGKKGLTDAARNVRQTNRYLEGLMEKSLSSGQDIFKGLALIPPHHLKNQPKHHGRLFFQNEELSHKLPESLPGNKADNSILATALALQKKFPELLVTLVSKDINLRIKAAVLSIHAEDYYNDKKLEDPDLMYTGLLKIDSGFWEKNNKQVDSWQEDGKTLYKISTPKNHNWFPNLCLFEDSTEDNTNFEAIIRSIEEDHAIVEYVHNYRKPKNKVCGITARNREQNFALNFLMDPNIDFVTLVGQAGTGKTLLTLAAALQQTLHNNLYREIIVTRVTVPVGDDIGFLPGTELEKMAPWMGAVMDNLEFLAYNEESGSKKLLTPDDLFEKRIKISSINFMRGRTFLNKFIIIDEAQNLTAKQMQTLVTRAGPGTKIVCLGNINQIDTPYLTETTSGLTYVVQQFKNWEHSAHITMTRGERSRLADHATKIL